MNDSNRSEIDGEMEDQIFTYGLPQKLFQNAFTKEHYDFVNWIGSDGNTYDNEQEMSSYTGDDLELSAVWKPSKYYVYFESDDESSGSMERQEFIYGQSQTLSPNQFIKEHYDFLGWIGSDGNRYANEEEIELSSNLSLTANWSRITSTMIFYRDEEHNRIDSSSDSTPPESAQQDSTPQLFMQPPSQSQSQITMIYL